MTALKILYFVVDCHAYGVLVTAVGATEMIKTGPLPTWHPANMEPWSKCLSKVKAGAPFPFPPSLPFLQL